MNTTTYMPETATEPIEEQPYFIAMSSGWTRFENSIYGDYDTNGCKPGLISYLDILEKTLYPILVRLTVGYSRTWTRVSLTNLQTLTGLSRNSVISAGQSLIEKGLVESRNNGGVTEWRILPDAVLPFIAAKNAEERAKMCHSDKPASAPHEPNWRATRAELVHETRQTSAPHEPPTRKERKKVEKKRKKDSLAPKNGASPAPDISADLPEPLTTSPSQVTPIEVTPIQVEVVQPPPVPKSPPKRANDEMFKFMAIACGYFTPASETADGKDNYHGKESRIGKELKELKTLNVNLAELEQMTAWLRGQWKYQDGRHINLADYRAELNNFRDHLKAVADNQVDGKAEVIKAIQATCAAPMDGWGGKAKRLGELAERIITRGEQGKVSGFKAWWLAFADSAPSLEQLINNWIKFTENNGGQHANNGKNRGRATTPLPPPPDAGLGGTANGGRKVTFAEFVGKQARV